MLTPTQEEALAAVKQYGGIQQAAKALDKDRRGFQRLVRRAEKAQTGKEVAIPTPDGIQSHKIEYGQRLKEYSALFSSERGEVLRWVKTEKDKDEQLEILREIVENWTEEAKGVIAPIEPPKAITDNLMSLYPMGDPHFGLYCWAREVGEAFDLKIAEYELCAAVDYLVDRSPNSERAILANLGDFFHYDSMENLTPASKHVLDADSRPQRMIEIGVRTLRRCIHRLLEKHETVELINVPGNHDPILARALNVMFANIYEKEERLIVHDNPTSRHYIEHGKCLNGFVHGHQTKDNDLPGIMATEMAEAWGRTKFRRFFRGHHHHDSIKDFNGCTVEQVRTMAPGDAYAIGAGYLSSRDMKCIVQHKLSGEQTRLTCGIDVLRQQRGE